MTRPTLRGEPSRRISACTRPDHGFPADTAATLTCSRTTPYAGPGSPRWRTRGVQARCRQRDEPHRDSPRDPRDAPPGGRDRRQTPSDHGRAAAPRGRRKRAGSARALPRRARRLHLDDPRDVRADEGMGAGRGHGRRRLRPSVDAAPIPDRDPPRWRSHRRAAAPPGEGRQHMSAAPLDRGRHRVRRADRARRPHGAGQHRQRAGRDPGRRDGRDASERRGRRARVARRPDRAAAGRRPRGARAAGGLATGAPTARLPSECRESRALHRVAAT